MGACYAIEETWLPPANGEETAENGLWRPSADNTVGSPSIYKTNCEQSITEGT